MTECLRTMKFPGMFTQYWILLVSFFPKLICFILRSMVGGISYFDPQVSCCLSSDRCSTQNYFEVKSSAPRFYVFLITDPLSMVILHFHNPGAFLDHGHLSSFLIPFRIHGAVLYSAHCTITGPCCAAQAAVYLLANFLNEPLFWKIHSFSCGKFTDL